MLSLKPLIIILFLPPPQLWSRVRLLHGGFWALPCLYVQLGLHHDHQTQSGGITIIVIVVIIIIIHVTAGDHLHELCSLLS